MNFCDHSPTRSASSLTRFLRNRHLLPDQQFEKRFKSNHFEIHDHLYYRDLVAHFGCVNSLEFSSKSEHLLASAGDDKRVLVWNLGRSLHNSDHKPTCMKERHISNVFCLAFDNQNETILSSGNDEQILIHKIETQQLTKSILERDAIYSISAHPSDVNVFASASENGDLCVYDTREHLMDGKVICINSNLPAFHGVMFNPCAPTFLAASHSKQGAGLWDVRKPKSILISYSPKQGDSTMSVRFNEMGTELLVLRTRGGPCLYSTHKADPVVLFKAQGYSNSCTMKSGCFAGESEEYVVSGSDDFKVYVWKVPKWASAASSATTSVVSTAQRTMKGHKSIVNQVRYSKRSQIFVTSGVEKAIKLWSPFKYPGCCSAKETSRRPQDRFSRNNYMDLILLSATSAAQHQAGDENTNEDPFMLAFFDGLIQHDHNQLNDDSDESDADSSSHSATQRYNHLAYSSSSSSSSDESNDPSLGELLMQRISQISSHPGEELLSRLRSIRSGISEEEEELTQHPNATTQPASSSRGSASGLSSENPATNSQTADCPVRDLVLERPPRYPEAQDEDSLDEDRNTNTRQRNARRRKKPSKWALSKGKDTGTEKQSTSSSELVSSEQQTRKNEGSRSAYERSHERLTETVARTNSRLEKVAENLAKVIHESTETDDETEDEENG